MKLSRTHLPRQGEKISIRTVNTHESSNPIGQVIILAKCSLDDEYEQKTEYREGK